MSIETKTNGLKEIFSVGDLKGLDLDKNTKLIMLAITPEELEHILSWADRCWDNVIRFRNKYTQERGSVKASRHRTTRPKFLFVAAKA